MNIPHITHDFVELKSARVFYREAGPADGLPMLLLHGFPSSSFQFRRLMDALGSKHRLIAPDYPGFGYSESQEGFDYTFESLADVLEAFVAAKGLHRFVLYLFDYGGPVGFRLALRNPKRVAGLIVQNANAYTEGLSAMAQQTMNAPAEKLRDLLTAGVTRSQYETGAGRRELIAADGWTLDQHFLDLPGRQEAQCSLLMDYKSNVGRYPEWQAWLRQHQPPTLIVWGKRDLFFSEAGARAYLRDVPKAQLHLFETGHFALEECLPEIAARIETFLSHLCLAQGQRT